MNPPVNSFICLFVGSLLALFCSIDSGVLERKLNNLLFLNEFESEL